MAQIKLGAAITDIKGKLGGQVFASNKGGGYIRTNKVGGGRKSPLWGTRKSKLNYIAGQWRNLTLEQIEAWNQYASENPVLNKVGTPVTLSGFQQFVKANIKALDIKLPLLAFPPSAFTPPYISNLEIDYPTAFQLKLQSNIVHAGTDATDDANQIKITPDTPFDMENGRCTFALRMKVDQSLFDSMQVGDKITFFDASGDQDFHFTVAFHKQSQIDTLIEFKGGSFAEHQLWDISRPLSDAYFNDELFLTFCVSHLSSLEDSSLLGLKDKSFNILSSGLIAPGANISEIVLNPKIVSGSQQIVYRSLVIYDKAFIEDELLQVNYGYILQNAVSACQFNAWQIENDTYVSESITDNTVFKNSSVWVGSSKKDFTNVSLPPLISIFKPADGTPPVDVRVFSSNALSYGRGGAISRKTLIGTFSVSGTSKNYIWEELYNFMPFKPVGANVRFFIDSFDPLTGQSTNVQEPPKKPKPKFKEGSELSGRVN